MTFPVIRKTALRIKFLADLLGCRKVILRAVECYNRHAVPGKGGISGPEFVSQIDGFLHDIAEYRPRDFAAGKTDSTAVDSLCIRPQPAAFCIFEEFTGFDVHPFALSASNKRQDQCNELWERQFALSGEIRLRLFDLRIDVFWNKFEKRLNNTGQLA